MLVNDIRLFSGTANRPLALQIAKKLKMKLSKAEVLRFSDGEIRVEITENVRGSTAYIIQPACAPTNDSLMELILLADALRRSSVGKIIAVIPLFPYSRQDRRPGYSRVPISARVVADMIESVGISHVVTVDLHATQIQGFFHIPIDNISATQLFVADIYAKYSDENPIIVSPDVGGVARARSLAKHLNNLELAIVDKRRPSAGVAEVMNIIGDVHGKCCIIVDDMCDSGGTICKGADALIAKGASKVVAYATHGVLSGGVLDNLNNSELFELVVTDTIPLRSELKSCKKIRVLSMAGLLAETVNCIHHNKSISDLLD
jgi:ribose-phosphate pyrophosphokinase